MNHDLIINQNIKEICFETVRISSLKITTIQKDITTFFLKYLISSKNVYISSFLINRLQKLISIKEDKYLYRKVLVEIYVFLAICNKPTDNETCLEFKKTRISKNDDVKKCLSDELKNKRDMDKIFSYIVQLEKTEKEYLWSKIYKLVSDNPLKKTLVINLFELYKITPNKDYILAAYKSLYIIDYIIDASVYHKLIFQCMLKINYLYEYAEIKEDLFLKCLNYVPHKNISITSNKFLVSYVLEKKPIKIEPNKTKTNEEIYFEKVY